MSNFYQKTITFIMHSILSNGRPAVLAVMMFAVLGGCDIAELGAGGTNDAPAVVRVSARVTGAGTKAELQTSDEKAVNTIDVFAFSSDGTSLLAHARAEGNGASVSLPKDRTKVCVLVNAPASVSELESYATVSAYHAAFADQARDSFFMSGEADVDVDASTVSTEVDVRRDVVENLSN